MVADAAWACLRRFELHFMDEFVLPVGESVGYASHRCLGMRTGERSLPMKRPWAVIFTAAVLVGCRSSQPATNPFLRTTVPPPATGQGVVVSPGVPYSPGIP